MSSRAVPEAGLGPAGNDLIGTFVSRSFLQRSRTSPGSAQPDVSARIGRNSPYAMIITNAHRQRGQLPRRALLGDQMGPNGPKNEDSHRATSKTTATQGHGTMIEQSIAG